MQRSMPFLFSSLLLLSLGRLTAADAPVPAPAPTTVSNPAVSLDDLRALLRPLTSAELKVEADAWQALLKLKTLDMSKEEIRARNEKDALEKGKSLEQQSKMKEEQTQIIDRLNVVLDAIKAKGGKVDEYESYISAVSGLNLQVTDASATMTTLVNWAKSTEGGIRWGKNIILFVVTLLVFKILAALLGKITSRMVAAFKGTSELLKDFFVNVVRKVTMFIGFVLALSMLEVNIGPFVAAIGVAGFVIGFALQGTLSNFAAGVMVLLYRPYDIGDRVTAAGQTGKVTSMTLVSTILQNDEGKTVTVPNNSIWGGVITNHGRAAAANPTPTS